MTRLRRLTREIELVLTAMYERFTDRARKVMQLADQEARRLNHEYIGTEHILLGLVREGGGVAANVLKNLNKNLNLDHGTIRREVAKRVEPGPDPVTMETLPQTPRAKKAVEYAQEEARGLSENCVDTAHLLLGLLREREGMAAQVLISLGVKLEAVRAEVFRLHIEGEKVEISPRRPQMDVVLQLRKEWGLRNHPVVRLCLRARETCIRMLSSPAPKQRQWAYQNLQQIAIQLERLYSEPQTTATLDARFQATRRPFEWHDLETIARLPLAKQVESRLRERQAVLLVGVKGSGRRTVAGVVAKGLRSQGDQLVLPNHLALAASGTSFREQVQVLAKDLAGAEHEITAVPALHEYLAMPSSQYDVADVWKGFLRTLLDRRAGVLAWTTPSGLDALRATWPGIVKGVHVTALEPLPDDLVAEVVRAHLRKLCDELQVVLEDGFLDELTSCKSLWKGAQALAEPGRSVSFASHVLRFERANVLAREQRAEHASLQAKYLQLRRELLDALPNRPATVDSLLPQLTEMRDQLGGPMATASYPRRFVAKTQILEFVNTL